MRLAVDLTEQRIDGDDGRGGEDQRRFRQRRIEARRELQSGEDGEYVYPYMGVGIDSINLFIQEQLGLPDTRGALVVSVTEEQPAALAGLVRDDVITAINGDAIVDSDGLISYLVFETEVGETVDLTVIRAGETLTIPLTLAARP